MNAEIERYRISLGQGAGNPDWGEDSEGDNTGSGSGVGEPTTPGPGGDDPDL